MHCETLNNPIGVEAINRAARERLLSRCGEPLFVADWLRPVFIHYEVPADDLQPHVPYLLDLFEGKAYVSLVAFTMRGMRPRVGGKMAAWLMKPIATNDYLNVRTYVTERNEPGIYFLSEWMNNRWSLRLGPRTFGLPYRFGNLHYQHNRDQGFLNGRVSEDVGGPSFAYEAEIVRNDLTPCPAGSLDEFLLERYTAFTNYGKSRRFFRIWHNPWKQCRLNISIRDSKLLDEAWPWFVNARLVGGNFSPGAGDVWMGWPHRI